MDLLSISGHARISLLKMDIEGAEIDVFSNKPSLWLDKVDALLIQCHDRFRPGCRRALDDAIHGRQVRRFRHGEYEGICLVS